MSETCAPGITAPEASCTLPVIEPDVFCAFKGELTRNVTMTKKQSAFHPFETIRCSSVIWRVVYKELATKRHKIHKKGWRYFFHFACHLARNAARSNSWPRK